MKKRTFDIAFKKEVIAYIDANQTTAYKATQYFNVRDKCCYNRTMFHQWYTNRDKILDTNNNRKRAHGAGRKLKMGELEEIIVAEVIELRLRKCKVTRQFIADRALLLAQENAINDFMASSTWISSFMARNNFSLRRVTNLTRLSDDDLLMRAVEYMRYLRNRISSINLANTLLMDETAVYFEDVRMRTVDFRGRSHVIIKTTGFSSMRVTAAMSIWADGRKAMPLVIHKGNDSNTIATHNGPTLSTVQQKGWVNQDLLIQWIDHMFPPILQSEGKCIVWDSCRAHISKRVKEHCRRRSIELIVIPGGMTPYLQAGDIGIFRSFKDRISSLINEWKDSDVVEYTRNGNPKPPSYELVQRWILDAWREIPAAIIANSIRSAGFGANPEEWHIAKHDIYGVQFLNKWHNAGDMMVDPEVLEEIGQDDDIDEIEDIADLSIED